MKLHEKPRQDAAVHLRMPAEMAHAISELAQRENLGLSEAVRQLLSFAIKRAKRTTPNERI